MGLVIAIIILGIGIAVVAFFLLRSVLAPKRLETIQLLLTQNKPEAAIKAAKQVLARDARNGDAHYLLGLAYEAEGNGELALMEFRSVNQIGDFTGLVDELSFRKKIAALYVDFNQDEEALKEYLLLAKKEPTESEHYVSIGRLFEARNRTDKAIEYYNRAIKLNGRSALARARLGLLLYRSKQLAEARSQLNAAVRLDPENYEAWFYVGRILKDSNDQLLALTAFEKASRDPELKVRSLIERGGCLIATGNTQRAISELERAVKLADENSQDALYAHYFLAHALEQTRRIELAIDHWEFIYRRKPSFKDVTEKMTQYQDLRTDDRVKDYLTAGPEQFAALCTRVAEVLGLTVRDTRPVEGGCEVIAVEASTKWRSTRTISKLLRFLRVSDVVEESTVRDTHEAMRSQNISRGVILTSSSFSKAAQEFALSRPIELVPKEKLTALLQKVEL